MKLSIFTATHDSKYLKEVYETIKDQDFYEWVVLYNHSAEKINFNLQFPVACYRVAL